LSIQKDTANAHKALRIVATVQIGGKCDERGHVTRRKLDGASLERDCLFNSAQVAKDGAEIDKRVDPVWLQLEHRSPCFFCCWVVLEFLSSARDAGVQISGNGKEVGRLSQCDKSFLVLPERERRKSKFQPTLAQIRIKFRCVTRSVSSLL
jgi:hypothetical protein